MSNQLKANNFVTLEPELLQIFSKYKITRRKKKNENKRKGKTAES